LRGVKYCQLLSFFSDEEEGREFSINLEDGEEKGFLLGLHA